VLAGGQGLAAGTTALLVNAIFVANVGDSIGSLAVSSIVSLLVGDGVGACNGVLVGRLRLP
jgi:ribose/xylose/arabinose/galactoside ABC-type transport system permease subunit